MKYHTLFAVTLLVSEIFQGACAKKVVPPPPPPSGIISGDSDRLQESLFKGDQAVLSNQDIEKILGAQITIADRHRLAILSLNSRSWYDESLTDAEAQNADHLIEVLKSSPQLSQVRFMPSLLIPEKRTVPYLREASARFQADLLLVYTTRIQSFRQNRLLGSDEVRARCVGESLLLDVRTGIVAHSARAIESIAVKKTSSDLNFSETVARAYSEATGKALISLANALITYLADGKR